MIIAGILLIVFAIIGVWIYSYELDDPTDGISIAFFGILIAFGIAIIIAGAIKDNPEEISLKDNELQIEIRQEIINGQEISIDTVYIFTPKRRYDNSR